MSKICVFIISVYLLNLLSRIIVLKDEFKPAPPFIWLNTTRLAVSDRKIQTIAIKYKNICDSISNLTKDQINFNFTTCINDLKIKFENQMHKLCLLKQIDNERFEEIQQQFRKQHSTKEQNSSTKITGLILGLASESFFYDLQNQDNLDYEMNSSLKKDQDYFNDYVKNLSQDKKKLLYASKLDCKFQRKLDRLEDLIKFNFKNWPKYQFNLDLLKELNINFANFGLALIQHSLPLACRISQKDKLIIFELDVAYSKPNNFIYQADPFLMFDSKDKKICNFSYTGYNLGLFNQSNNKICYSEKEELDYNNCYESISKRNGYFKKDYCSEDLKPLVQVKKYGNKYFIYCFGNKIKINNKINDCPNYVFELSEKYDIFELPNDISKTDDDRYQMSDINLNEKFNNLLMDLNYYENWKDEKLINLENLVDRYKSNPIYISLILSLILIIITIATCCICKFMCPKKSHIRIKTTQNESGTTETSFF